MEQSRYHPRPLCGDSVGPSKCASEGASEGAAEGAAERHPKFGGFGDFWEPSRGPIGPIL